MEKEITEALILNKTGSMVSAADAILLEAQKTIHAADDLKLRNDVVDRLNNIRLSLIKMRSLMYVTASEMLQKQK